MLSQGALRTKEYRPEVIVQFGSSADAAETLKQLHNAGITAPFASAENVLLDPDILRAEGCLIATSFLLPTPESGPAVQNFIQRYKQRYGAEPGPYALEAYDAASAFLKAIQAGNHTPKDINNYLATTAFTGLSRSIQFRSDGENSALPVYIFQIKNGQPALIGNATTAS